MSHSIHKTDSYHKLHLHQSHFKVFKSRNRWVDKKSHHTNNHLISSKGSQLSKVLHMKIKESNSAKFNRATVNKQLAALVLAPKAVQFYFQVWLKTSKTCNNLCNNSNLALEITCNSMQAVEKLHNKVRWSI